MTGKPPSLKPQSFLWLQICWQGSRIREIVGFHQVNIWPTNEYPFGRKGYTLAYCWEHMIEDHTKGMVILDGDVAVDPIDISFMQQSMVSDPNSIHIGPARIWPKSTNFSQWVWAHRKFGTVFKDWQTYRTDVDTASFCFTYLPRTLIEKCIDQGLATWAYPNVDFNVFRVAREESIAFKVVDGCIPKHMNY